MKPGVNVQAAAALRCGQEREPGAGRYRCTMETIWQMLFTGMGIVMIMTTAAVVIGLFFLLWWTRRID